MMINKETDSVKVDYNFNDKKLAPYKINEVLVFPVIKRAGYGTGLNKYKYLLQIIMIKDKQNKSFNKIKGMRIQETENISMTDTELVFEYLSEF